MDFEKIKTMSLEEIESRKSEIEALVRSNDESTDFGAINKELDALEERKLALIEEQRKNDIEAVIAGAGEDVTENFIEKESRKMADIIEIRNSAAYLDAFAEVVKTGGKSGVAECRALLSTNAPEDGSIVVPTLVEDKIRTAWEESELFSRISKSYVKGNLAVGFEISGTDAVIHEEGTAAPDEESLVIGTVTIVPKFIKKWITISDEVMSLRGEAFLNYVYDELKYKIVKKAEDVVITKILANVGASTATKAGQATTSAAIGRAGIIDAISYISDEARDLIAVMSRRTWAAYEATRTLNGGDPFADLPVVYNNGILKDYDTAVENDAYAIVGDFAYGFRANLPNGYDVKITVDENSLSEADLVKVTGKLYAGLEAIAQNAFCVITKPGEGDGEG